MLELSRFIGQYIKANPYFLRDAEHVRALQQKRLRALLRHAVRHSPFYAKRFVGIDIETCTLADLPTLTKSEMMENFDAIVTDRSLRKEDAQRFVENPDNLGKLYRGRYGIAHTSGSQGRPALIVQDRQTLAMNFAIQVTRSSGTHKKFCNHLDRVWSPARVAIVTQRPGFYPSGFSFSYLPPGLKPFFKTKWFSVFDPIEKTVADLRAYAPNYITGYTSGLETIVREEEAGRLKLRETGALEQVINISEPLPAPIRARMEQAFGVPVTDQYSMGECLGLSSGCQTGPGAHLNSDFAILEVVDADYHPVPVGVRGAKVLVTNLYNHVQPFIRYEIDDLVTMSATPCACGSPLPLVKSIEGRSKDKLWIEVDGRYRDLPYYLFLAALHNELDMAEHQVLQTGANAYVVKAAPLPGRTLSSDKLRALVLQSVRSEGLDRIIKLDIEIVDHIERGPSGKAIRVKNLIGPPPAAANGELVSQAIGGGMGERAQGAAAMQGPPLFQAGE